jgi:uncharacterized membrane protein YidH (DUF202 family)
MRLAVDRTRLAYERTMMAWVRTATSMISFGFTIHKFFQFRDDGLLWNLMRRCPAVVTGLRRAGFSGGWL